MNAGLLFVIVALGLFVAWFAWRFKGVPLYLIKGYFLSEDGKNILRGIGVVIVIAVLLGLSGLVVGAEPNTRYFNWASVYVGMDYMDKQSPQCKAEGYDDRTTSNVGLKLNVMSAYQGRVTANAKFTHHSCAFNQDRQGYNGYGFEVEYRFWNR